MSRERYTVSTLEQFVGQEMGVSDWLTVDQQRINEFADCTSDHQWIHNRTGEIRGPHPHSSDVAGNGSAGQGSPVAHIPEHGRD
jgi:hypothetical protein